MTFQSVQAYNVREDYQSRDFKGFINRYIEQICYRAAENLTVNDEMYWLRQEFLIWGLNAVAKPYYCRNAEVSEKMEDCINTMRAVRGDRYKYLEAMYAWLTELVAYFKKLNFFGEVALTVECPRQMSYLGDEYARQAIGYILKNGGDAKLSQLIKEAKVPKPEPKRLSIEDVINPAYVKKGAEKNANA